MTTLDVAPAARQDQWQEKFDKLEADAVQLKEKLDKLEAEKDLFADNVKQFSEKAIAAADGTNGFLASYNAAVTGYNTAMSAHNAAQSDYKALLARVELMKQQRELEQSSTGPSSAQQGCGQESSTLWPKLKCSWLWGTADYNKATGTMPLNDSSCSATSKGKDHHE